MTEITGISPGFESREDYYFGYGGEEGDFGEYDQEYEKGEYDQKGVLQGYSLLPYRSGQDNMNCQHQMDHELERSLSKEANLGPSEFDEGLYGYGVAARAVVDGRYAAASPSQRSPGYMRDRGEDLDRYPDLSEDELAGHYVNPSEHSERSARRKPARSPAPTMKTTFVKVAHEKIRSKYAGSVSIAETYSTPKREFRSNSRYRDHPKKLAAHVVEQEVDTDTQVIHIKESEFLDLQKDLFGRSERDVKEIRARAAKHIFEMTEKNFSIDMNPNVEKFRSSLVIKEGEGKDAKSVVKLSPYTVGSNVSWKVDVADGFPSIKENDRLMEIGYVFNILNPSGVKVHGAIGGKEGKVMKPGESLYFCDFMIRPSRSMRKPVWIRARSVKPSETVDDYERKAEFKIGYISLFQDGKVEPLNDFTGTAERTIRIEPVTVTSKAKKDAKSKAKEETLSKKKKATAGFVVHFDPEPMVL